MWIELQSSRRNQKKLPWGEKLRQISWGMVLLICCVASIGFAMLYSAAHGSAEPWMDRQITRFGIGVVLMFGAAMVDLRKLMRYAYLFYGLAIVMLLYVDFSGEIGRQCATPSDAVRRIFLREPTPDELRDFSAFAGQNGAAALCRVLLNSNEFLFVN